MPKTHPPKKIVFCPTNIEISHDGNQGIWFVYLETEPLDYEGTFPVKNPKTGKIEGKREIRKFSHLRLTFNSQSEINRFSYLVKKGQIYEVETSWSSGGESGRRGKGLVEQVNINEINPQIKISYRKQKQSEDSQRKMVVLSIVVGGGILILGIIFGLFWQRKRKLNKQK